MDDTVPLIEERNLNRLALDVSEFFSHSDALKTEVFDLLFVYDLFLVRLRGNVIVLGWKLGFDILLMGVLKRS